MPNDSADDEYPRSGRDLLTLIGASIETNQLTSHQNNDVAVISPPDSPMEVDEDALGSTDQLPDEQTTTIHPDRSDYWIQAIQIYYLLQVSDFLHPLHNETALDNARSVLYEGFNTILGSTYARWVELLEQLERREDMGGPARDGSRHLNYRFIFMELVYFLDVAKPEWSISEKAQKFFWTHVRLMKHFCGCGECKTANDILMGMSEEEANNWFKVFDIDHQTVAEAVKDLMVREVEDPAFRQTSKYKQGLSECKENRQTFGRLGEEIDWLCINAVETRKSLNYTRRELGFEDDLSPESDCVEPVVTRDDIDSPDCPICFTTYEMSCIGHDSEIYEHRPVRARCNHILCAACFNNCITSGLERAYDCPQCRQSFKPPPLHETAWAALRKAFDDKDEDPEPSAKKTLDCLDAYLANLPVDLQNLRNAHFPSREKPPALHELIHHILGPTGQVLEWVDDSLSPESSEEAHYQDKARLGIEYLYLCGERLRAYLEGDTKRYRAILTQLWPIFVRYQICLFISQVDHWIYDLELQMIFDEDGSNEESTLLDHAQCEFVNMPSQAKPPMSDQQDEDNEQPRSAPAASPYSDIIEPQHSSLSGQEPPAQRIERPATPHPNAPETLHREVTAQIKRFDQRFGSRYGRTANTEPPEQSYTSREALERSSTKGGHED
ncbi:hypothetical protein BDV96DRAFT_650673 [Lophiotrema nucula]|uniref:RING-type domain-containing protein n=1 Tax=Lophiotrema nucula TaxID=690887 RepID=A0A6A5YU72_9PLEO|nr:hypothetical protein BDV96DRAFT_650673 [Lophiotrema nucula]